MHYGAVVRMKLNFINFKRIDVFCRVILNAEANSYRQLRLVEFVLIAN